MGLAVYNSIILDLHFPSICYRKILTPPVVPAREDAPVGIVSDPTIEDLAEIMPDVAQSLKVRKLNFLPKYGFYSCLISQ
jgi:E3 ubiquitin-protein ligase HECTD2